MLMALTGHDAQGKIMAALATAALFVIPSMVVNHSYALKSAKLMAIDAGHWLLVFVVMGLAFAALGG